MRSGQQESALSRKRTKVIRDAQQGGFTLVEVLVAIVILAVGLLAVARLQSQAVRSNNFGNQLNEATFLAQDKAEELRVINKRYLADTTQDEPSAIRDTKNNWTVDSDGDGINDEFNWTNPESTETNLDVTGTSGSGQYTREYCVVDNVPVLKAKTIHVRVKWGTNRQVIFKSMISH
jgi:type IV pilus modification protein PilV